MDEQLKVTQLNYLNLISVRFYLSIYQKINSKPQVVTNLVSFENWLNMRSLILN